MTFRERAIELLRQERDGDHGSLERRGAAEYLLEQREGWPEGDDRWIIHTAEHLSYVAMELADRLTRLYRRGDQEGVAEDGAGR